MKKITRGQWFYSDECHALMQLARIEKYLRDKQQFLFEDYGSYKNPIPRIAFEAAMWEIQCSKCRVYQTFEVVE